MKQLIKIIFVVLIVWPKVFFGQTYFNMLYPPALGTWGGGSETVVVRDSMYFMNRWFIDNDYGRLGHHFTTIASNGVNFEITDTVHSIDQWIAAAGLSQGVNNSFIDFISIHSYNPSIHQYGVVKYDSIGHILFHNIDTAAYPYIYITQAISLQDGSTIAVGNLRPNFGGSVNERYALLIKSDSLGNQVWKKTYNIGNYIEGGESVALCADGGYVIGGTELDISGQDDFYSPLVIKTDSNGDLEWQRKYGSTEYSNWPAYGITQTQDGGYVFCGGIGLTDSNFVDEQMPWVVKLDATGNILWADTNSGNNTRDGHQDTFFRDVIELDDGSIVVCGNQKQWLEEKPGLDKHRWRGVIKKLSPTGTPLWVRYYNHPEINDNSGSAHMLYDIDPTPDGGFVAAGYATFTVDNVQSTWVVKVDSFGCLEPGCEVVSVPKIEGSIASLKIYPNPASEILNIEITSVTNQEQYTFNLYDILGKRVLSKTLQSNQNTINIVHLASGVYTYKIGEVWGQVVKQ